MVGQVNLIDTPALEQLSNELRILGVWLDKMVSYPKVDGRFVWSFGSDVSIKNTLTVATPVKINMEHNHRGLVQIIFQPPTG